ncbi:type III secretion system gatekeeper subunit SctW [Erwinia sp. MMLR14_017]|uniref:type III secretion system gatekeeper subunit SctW n=1 Tax=Erwinia sp. MMLR14_017 TaxID=3093842 RepID=UPI00298F5601|nr:type III secretion system gatekeeper subunit SctW [Erwinia sp. MMLR14_017]MDW8846063.1 type III secretion system gatekeeper subunit SctW [Erwinia sp. MMLR14_017]
MIKVQSSFQYQQALAKTLLKQDSPRAMGSDLRARPVNTQSAAASLSDSLEEIGMMFSEKVEKKTKGLNRRQINTQHLRSNRGAVERIERLGELYQMLDGQQQDRLETRLSALKDVLSKESEPEAETLVEAADNDPARCDLLLRMTLREADRTGDIQTAAAASNGLDALHEKFGDKVRAGLNTAPAVASFTTDPNEKQGMRDLYYHSIVKHQSPAVMLDSLLERFGREQFKPGLRTLQRALSEDIAALTPSISSRSLHKIHLALSEAGQLTHVLAGSDKLLSDLRSRGKIPASAPGGIEMTRRLLNVAETGLQGRDITGIGKEFAGEKATAQMLFFNGFLPLMNAMPRMLWRDLNDRPAAAKLLRSAIGMMVDNEHKAAAKG